MTSFCTSPYRETARSRTLINGSCSASWASADRSATWSSRRTGSTTASRAGGAKWWVTAVPLARPSGSPTFVCASPHSLPISPARTVSRRTQAPSSKTLIAVTLSGPPSTRSRVRIVPENIRAYATFSPATPRSILKMRPLGVPSVSPVVTGSNATSPSISASTPAPVIAEPT